MQKPQLIINQKTIAIVFGVGNRHDFQLFKESRSILWYLWGTHLVFQQVDLTKPYNPEAAIWNPTQGLQVVAGNAMFPTWLF